MSNVDSTLGGQDQIGWRKFLGFAKNLLREEDKMKWVEDMRGSLSLTASIIATMSFQLATNPPGGVFQANGGTCLSNILANCRNATIPCPGEAVLAMVYPNAYQKFLISNTICTIASLSVCLLLVSGIPIKHRFIIWILSIGMCITITSLALTYMFATSMVTPDPVWKTANSLFSKVLIVWVGLLGIVALYIIMRMLYRVIKWIRKCFCCNNDRAAS